MNKLRIRTGVAFIVAGMLLCAWVLRAAAAPIHSPAREQRHIRTLDRQLAHGAGLEMQRMFPEGEFFTRALTGLTAGRQALDGIDVEYNTALLHAQIEAINEDTIAGIFGGDHRGVPHGAFYHGWRLQLLVLAAELGDSTDRSLAHDEAQSLLAALDDPHHVPLTSYPGQAWPCDLIVAWSAVHRADHLTEVEGLDEATERLLSTMDSWRDPQTGLLGERFTAQKVTRATGSSQAIINTFLQDIDESVATSEWKRFREQFVTHTWGLIGVREHPLGIEGTGNVDSGPLIAGVSLSASAVTMGAALANGDDALAHRLNQQAELLGLPLPWRGRVMLDGRAMAFGAMPVGDAFVVASRTTSSRTTMTTVPYAVPGPGWPLWISPGLAFIVAGILLVGRGRRPHVS